MRHRRGTPGLTPYRLRTIEAGYPRRRRPARHLRNAKAGSTNPESGNPNPTVVSTTEAAPIARRGACAGPSRRVGKACRRLTAGRGSRPAQTFPQVALGVAGAITLALLIVGGYQAATGAAVVLGMF